VQWDAVRNAAQWDAVRYATQWDASGCGAEHHQYGLHHVLGDWEN